jgi:hypothetical protein
MPEKKGLVDAISEARYDTAVNAWLEYYDAAEARDRAYPHQPAYKHGKGVLPIRPRRPFKMMHPGLKDLVAERNRKLQGLSADEISRAQHVAEREHERLLQPCDCSTCEGHRR